MFILAQPTSSLTTTTTTSSIKRKNQTPKSLLLETMEEEVVSDHDSEGENNQMSEPTYVSDDDDDATMHEENEDETYSKYEDEDEDEDEDEEPLLKKPKTPKTDRISALPDSIIHHILSFLPTSKDAVKTGVLSKRWELLWTRVPNLIFRYHYHPSPGKVEKFFNFIDKTLILYSSPKINKFVLHFYYYFCRHPVPSLDSRIGLWIRFALRHNVNELCLKFRISLSLPQYFYNNSELVKLKSMYCNYLPNAKVYWNSLKILSITYAKFSDDAIHKILQGSPVLECFELNRCRGIKNLNITSKCLKKLVINGIWDGSHGEDVSMIEISAPNLQSLEILGYWFGRKCRLMNVSSLVSATLDYELAVDIEESNHFYGEYRNMLKELLEKVDHVKELTLGTWCIQVLSISEVKNSHFPPSNRKCLILDMCFHEWDLPGLASLLHSSPKLEKLVIDMSSPAHSKFDMHRSFYNSYHFGENYWTSKKWIFKCLLLHLKTIEIVGPKARGNWSERLFAFLQFLLSNSKVLEKMVITENYDQKQRKLDLYEVAQKLLSFPRSSPRAVILLPKMM